MRLYIYTNKSKDAFFVPEGITSSIKLTSDLKLIYGEDYREGTNLYLSENNNYDETKDNCYLYTDISENQIWDLTKPETFETIFKRVEEDCECPGIKEDLLSYVEDLIGDTCSIYNFIDVFFSNKYNVKKIEEQYNKKPDKFKTLLYCAYMVMLKEKPILKMFDDTIDEYIYLAQSDKLVWHTQIMKFPKERKND